MAAMLIVYLWDAGTWCGVTDSLDDAQQRAAERIGTLAALEEPATADNTLYAGTGLFMAAQAREHAAREGLTQPLLGEKDKPKENTMNDIDLGSLKWFESSFSAAGACVEVAHLPSQAGVAVRDSKDRSRPPHFYTAEEWNAFLAGAKAGEFDLP
jgi:hypothetical protein